MIIGQGAELDYAAHQACEALRNAGYEVVAVSSNPATLLTAPGVADRVYMEPLTLSSVARIVEKEKPDAILPTVGGQEALNLAGAMEHEGILQKMGCKIIGTAGHAIARSEDAGHFRERMNDAEIKIPKGGIATSLEEGTPVLRELGFPVFIKPAYAMSGAGSSLAYNREEFWGMLAMAIATSPIHQALITESLLGWKEIEVEALRDCTDNVQIAAVIENIDPVGVHTGDSTAVFPPQTLAPEQIESLTDISAGVMRAVDVIGSANIQFAINQDTGEILVLEINARAGRTSAFASKATGTPIARVAALLSVGSTLEEIGCGTFPTRTGICAVKVPHFAFNKFPDVDPVLNTSMKAVGESMAVGCEFTDALQLAIRSNGSGRMGLGADGLDLPETDRHDIDLIREKLAKPNADRLFFLRYALQNGITNAEIHELSGIATEFIESVRELLNFESSIQGKSLVGVPSEALCQAKKLGYSDAQLAHILETDEEQVRLRRRVLGVTNAFVTMDTYCSADSIGLCLYSTYDHANTAPSRSGHKRIAIIGTGANTIGLGPGFNYCCIQAIKAIDDEGMDGLMIDCNPASITTDASISDELYLEPLTNENVADVLAFEQPAGVIASFGGKTSAQLLASIAASGTQVLGTAISSYDRISDRKKFRDMLKKLGLKQPANIPASKVSDALAAAEKIGYPVLVKSEAPSEQRGQKIIYDSSDLAESYAYLDENEHCADILVTQFIEDATRISVNAVADGDITVICGIMEHIEHAAVHSGDSACSLPSYSLTPQQIEEIKRQTKAIASELNVRGPINISYAAINDDIYVLYVSLFASRSLPFVSRATGIEWARVAARVMLGRSLREQGITEDTAIDNVCVRESVFPFVRFAGANVVLGPDMKSTGEAMGIDTSFGNAYMKAQIAAGQNLPEKGTAFVSVADFDKSEIVEIGKKLKELGFSIVATKGTAKALREAGIETALVPKIGEGRPDATDLIKNGSIDLIINTLSGKKPRKHEVTIRSAMVARGIPIVTTIAGAKATLFGMEIARKQGTSVRSLADYYKK